MSDAIKLAIDALEIGLDCAQEVAHRTHEELKGYKPHRHAAVDADVAKIEAALAALRAQPESVCPECHCHFTSNEVTAPGSTRLVNTAQPDQIVDANEMVDHSELVNRLRHVGDDHIGEVCMVCHEAADALIF